MAIDLELLNNIMEEALACACNALNLGICDEPGSTCGCPCRMFISAGPPVQDVEACCSDGQLTVHLDRIYPFSSFPAQDGGPHICQIPLAADLVVTLYRCFPVMNEDGSAPSGPEIDRASKDINRDLYLLSLGLLCCLSSHQRHRKFVFSGGRIIPPSGGCVGAEFRFTVELFDV